MGGETALDIDQLLAPVSDEEPTGEDLEYDPEFGELQRSAQRKPEQELGEHTKDAVEPDWAAVQKQAVALFERTKDLRIAVHLTTAAARTDGFAGLRDGLTLVQQLSEQFWDGVYPRLDEDDDPTIRCNAVQELVNPGLDGILQAVLDAPFVSSRVAGRFCLRDLKIISGDLKQQEEDTRPTPQRGLVEAAFQDVESEENVAIAELLSESAEAVKQLQELYVSKVGSVAAPDLTELTGYISEIDTFVNEQLQRLGLAESPADDAGSGGSGTAPVTGDVSSREDVVRMLDKICSYYERSEPSSPIPMLLHRAKSLVHKGFMEIIADLTPSGVMEAKVFNGAEYDEGGSSGDGWSNSSS